MRSTIHSLLLRLAVVTAGSLMAGPGMTQDMAQDAGFRSRLSATIREAATRLELKGSPGQEIERFLLM